VTARVSEVSVVICSHSPRSDYLRRTLEALKTQTLAREQWELVLIDNASRERLADAWDLSWHPHGRHVREDEPGLTPSRLRGIRETGAELLIFVDDDNVLARDYLEHAVSMWRRHPHLGVFGAGVLHPEFEVQPDPELAPLLHLLAIRSVPSARWSNHLKDTDCFPWGAGLCVQRETAERFSDLVQRLNAGSALGRRGEQLFCAEDDLFSWAAVEVGLGFGVFPELHLTHLISARRLGRPYFLRLIRGHGFSHGVLQFLMAGVQPRALSVRRAARILSHGARRGLFSMRCQRARVRGEADAREFILANRLKPIGRGGAP
jgi:glycosyltransferase involved in cell wall biosynthesis